MTRHRETSQYVATIAVPEHLTREEKDDRIAAIAAHLPPLFGSTSGPGFVSVTFRSTSDEAAYERTTAACRAAGEPGAVILHTGFGVHRRTVAP